MTHHIAPQPWMSADAVTRVLRALDSENIDVRFVGGAVRNAVMGLPVTEVDLATPEEPPRVQQRLESAGLKAVPTGIEHGTVMAVADAETFEITTLRKDTACDGRHAAVEFTTDWREDARRRDFTFNAMSMRPDGAVFDDHGGWDDAKAGRVRFVGVAADRIQEDYLRILRLFRFFAWYGREPLDHVTLLACRTHVGGLARLSAERVQQELAKLLAAPKSFDAVKLMAECDVLAAILPEARDIAVLTRLQTTADWLLRLAALLPDDAAAKNVAARLKLSNAERDRLLVLTAAEPALTDRTAPQTLRHALYHLGAALVADRILLAWAKTEDSADAAPPDPTPWRALLSAAAAWEPKTLPVRGEDVLGFGVKPGPDVGRLLAAVEEWWIGAGFGPGRTEALDHLKSLIAK